MTAEERIEHKISLRRAIAHRVGNQGDWLDGRMYRERVVAPYAKTIHAGIGPDVAAIASMAAEFDIILMRRLAEAKNANQFVLAAIERALAGVGLVPDDQIERQTIDLASDVHQNVNVPPVHADEMQGPVARGVCC
jgi:hypothetical protein